MATDCAVGYMRGPQLGGVSRDITLEDGSTETFY